MSRAIEPPVYSDETNLNSLLLLRYLTSGVLKSAYEVSICCVLLSHRNSKTGLTCPFISSISKESCCSKSTVKRILKSLESTGFIIHVPRFIDNEKTSSLYFFTFDLEFLYRMSLYQQDNWEHPFHSDYDMPETIESVYDRWCL